MNWHKEGIGAAIAEAKSKGEIFAVFVKSKLWNLLYVCDLYVYVYGLT